MLKDSRKTMGHGDLRFLKNPVPLQIETGNYQLPLNVLSRGRWWGIEAILDQWHVEDEWWKPDSIDRMYYECVLNNGKYIVLYMDCISNAWYKQ
jgi:hypothetical protein